MAVYVEITAEDGAAVRREMMALLGAHGLSLTAEAPVRGHTAEEAEAVVQATDDLADKVKRKRRTKEELAAAIASGKVEVDLTNTVSQPERIVEVKKEEEAAPVVETPEAPKANLSPENLAAIANALHELLGIDEARKIVVAAGAPRVREMTAEQKAAFYEAAKGRLRTETNAKPEHLALVGL
jgi:hypothetical protein